MVRLLASMLRADGRKVVAKTTGSEAKVILPNGSEREVVRRGNPSIIEQKKLIQQAASSNADVLVAEVMSIHPENHFTECHRILKPHILGITNIRNDHVDAMGDSETAVAEVLSLTVTKDAKVFLPLESSYKPMTEAIHNQKGKMIPVSCKYPNRESPQEFQENIDLATAIASHLGVADQAIQNGIKDTRHDIGSYQIWKFPQTSTRPVFFAVNAFATNDPESANLLFERIRKQIPVNVTDWIPILNMRWDRGDRTLQWVKQFKNESEDWSRIIVTGGHGRAFERKVQKAKYVKPASPTTFMDGLCARLKQPAVFVGLGNLEGMGKTLVQHWCKVGEACGI